MKKLILSILFILCLSFQASAWNPMMLLSGGVASCEAEYIYDTSDAFMNAGEIVTRAYAGFRWTPATNETVCQVDFYMDEEVGDPSVNDYYIEIWTMSGDNLNVLQGRSDKVDGLNGTWFAVYVEFAFSTPVSLDASTEYAVTIKAVDDGDPADTVGEADAANYIRLG